MAAANYTSEYRYRILLVDDEPIQRTSIRDYINEQAYPFYVSKDARNGQEALDYLETNGVDIVLTDVKMPLKSGLTLAGESAKRYPHLVYVFISGFQDFEYVQQAVKLEAVDYLLKPIEPDELIQALYRSLERIKKMNVISVLDIGDTSAEESVTQSIKHEVCQNYRSFPSLKELAERFTYSPAYLSSSFKRDTGMTINQYLTIVRLEKACSLMENTDKYLYEIADEVGYRDLKHFRLLFEREKGIGPSEWRNHHKSGSNR